MLSSQNLKSFRENTQNILSGKIRASNVRILRVFNDTHLGNSHEGLANLAAKQKVRLWELEPGELVVFVNTSRTAFKLFGAGNSYIYHREPGNGRLYMDAIQNITQGFGGRPLAYPEAVKKTLTDLFAAKKKVLVNGH